MRQSVEYDSFAASPMTADAEESPMGANRFELDLHTADQASSTEAGVLENEKAVRKASAQLRQKELTDFIEHAVEGLQQVGSDGKILWANPAQLKLLGYAAHVHRTSARRFLY
jgi:PAS domain-containing protein